MSNQVYNDLLLVMQKRGGTYSGMDIPEFYTMVKVLFNPDEAQINNAMPKGLFTVSGLSKTLNMNENAASRILEGMADKGLCMALKMDGVQFYQSARLMPGIFEFQFMSGKSGEREQEIARVIHDYKKAYDQAAKDDPKRPASSVASYRVITVNKTIQAGNTIHTYDQVQSYIENNEEISVSTCYCRHAAALRGEDTHDMPMNVCMQFGMSAQFAVERLGGKKLTKDEALNVLDKAEEAGLIHMSQNVTGHIDFLCNCDRWHCVVVNEAMRNKAPGLYFNSGFEPVFDAETCVACETCIDRCPPEALVMEKDNTPAVDLLKCFGCAVCATGCLSQSIEMNAKQDFPIPPENFKALKADIKAGIEL